MATPPSDTRFKKEDFPSSGISTPDALDRLFLPLNAFLDSTRAALAKGLTPADNWNAEVKSFTVTTPATPWITPTLLNGVTNFAAGNEVAGYFKDDRGMVHLKGLVKGVALGVTILILPAGYRPAENTQTTTPVNSGSEAQSRLEVLSTGVVNIKSSGGTFASIRVTFESSDLSPGIMSCFPLTVSTKVTKPIGVFLLKVRDTTSAPLTCALGGLQWQATSTGQLQVTNLPGLIYGKTYELTLLILGG